MALISVLFFIAQEVIDAYMATRMASKLGAGNDDDDFGLNADDEDDPSTKQEFDDGWKPPLLKQVPLPVQLCHRSPWWSLIPCHHQRNYQRSANAMRTHVTQLAYSKFVKDFDPVGLCTL